MLCSTGKQLFNKHTAGVVSIYFFIVNKSPKTKTQWHSGPSPLGPTEDVNNKKKTQICRVEDVWYKCLLAGVTSKMIKVLIDSQQVSY